MRQKLGAYFVVPALGFGLLISACGDLEGDAFGDAAVDLIEILGPVSTDLSESPDAGDQAAGASSEAVDRRKSVKEAFDEAKKELDVGLPDRDDNFTDHYRPVIEKAIELAPNNGELRIRKAAIEVMDGKDPTQTKGEAVYLMARFSKPGDNARQAFLEEYIVQLSLGTRASESVTQEQAKRAQAEQCAHIEIFSREFFEAFQFWANEAPAAFNPEFC